MLIAQITDTHIVPKGKDWLDKPETKVTQRLKRVITTLNSLNPVPDTVVLTGDTVDKGDIESYKHLKELLNDLEIPYFLIPGNHDDRLNMQTVFNDTTYLPSHGFLQYTVDQFPVRLIGLDTNVPGEDYGKLCDKQIAWLKERLEENREKPTLLFMHHPLVKVGRKLFDAMGCQTELEFESLIKLYPNVLGIIAGHYHKLFITSYANKPYVICPSVAPNHYFSSPGSGKVDAIDLSNPGIILYQYEENTPLSIELVQVVFEEDRLPWVK